MTYGLSECFSNPSFLESGCCFLQVEVAGTMSEDTSAVIPVSFATEQAQQGKQCCLKYFLKEYTLKDAICLLKSTYFCIQA